MATRALRALLAAGALLAASACGSGAAAAGTASAPTSPPRPLVSTDAYLDAVHAGTGNEAVALEAGYLVCAMAYNGNQIDSILIHTRYDGPHLWGWDGLDDYETAAKTHLCPR